MATTIDLCSDADEEHVSDEKYAYLEGSPKRKGFSHPRKPAERKREIPNGSGSSDQLARDNDESLRGVKDGEVRGNQNKVLSGHFEEEPQFTPSKRGRGGLALRNVTTIDGIAEAYPKTSMGGMDTSFNHDSLGIENSNGINSCDARKSLAMRRADLVSQVEEQDSTIKNLAEQIKALQDQVRKCKTKKRELWKSIESLDNGTSGHLPSLKWESEDFPHSEVARATLLNRFGFEDYRPMQLCAINATLAGENAFVVMPTGSGKSLVFQLPALVDKKVTIVICPLISLSHDQVMNLRKRDIAASMLSSETPRSVATETNKKLRNGEVRLLYLTPEKIAKSKQIMAAFTALNDRGMLGRFVIDEAHCCSTMGHDFRPDYRQLHILKSRFPRVPLLAVTATATTTVENDVRNVLLGNHSWLVFRSTFNRRNLHYEVLDKKASAKGQLEQIGTTILSRFKNQCGIVYCYSRPETEELADALSKMGIRAAAYHAQMNASEKEDVHVRWSSWNGSSQRGVQVICATCAFGMGIDKPDVRFVFHRTLPKATESYCQESGRAGRDGLKATCIIFYRRADLNKVSSLVSRSRHAQENVKGILRYCESVDVCRRSIMADFFDERLIPSESCQGHCDICLQLPSIDRLYEKRDITAEAEKVLKILGEHANKPGKLGRITMSNLIKLWRPGFLSISESEKVIVQLLLKDMIQLYFVDNAYSTNTYLKPGTGVYRLNNGSEKILIYLKRKTGDIGEEGDMIRAPEVTSDKDLGYAKKRPLVLSPFVADDENSKDSVIFESEQILRPEISCKSKSHNMRHVSFVSPRVPNFDLKGESDDSDEFE